MDLRIRACHVTGSFVARATARRPCRPGTASAVPPEFVYERLSHPPATFRQEKLKAEVRLPAARKFIAEHRLNEVFDGSRAGRRHHRAGRPLQQRAARAADARARRSLRRLPHSDPRAERRLSARAGGDLGLLRGQAGGARRRGRPAGIHRAGHRDAPRVVPTFRRSSTARTCWCMAGEYTTEVIVRGLARFLAAHARAPRHVAGRALAGGRWTRRADAPRSCSARRCRRARRPSASAARSARYSRR